MSDKSINFRPWLEVWPKFCKDHPEFGLIGTNNSFNHFRRSHGKALLRYNVMRKNPQKMVVLDANFFPDVAYDYLIGNLK